MAKVIDIQVLNEVFTNKKNYLTQKEIGHYGVPDGYDGSQGEYNEYFNYYRHHDFPEGVFMRETIHTDSYGDNESIVKIEFVEGVAKTVIVYEPINK